MNTIIQIWGGDTCMLLIGMTFLGITCFTLQCVHGIGFHVVMMRKQAIVSGFKFIKDTSFPCRSGIPTLASNVKLAERERERENCFASIAYSTVFCNFYFTILVNIYQI